MGTVVDRSSIWEEIMNKIQRTQAFATSARKVLLAGGLSDETVCRLFKEAAPAAALARHDGLGPLQGHQRHVRALGR